MDNIKRLFQSYSIKLFAILIVTCLISWVFKIYILSGIVMIVLTLYVLVRSFKDPIMKKKKVISKIIIYFFIAIFLVSGLMTMGGNSNKNTDILRQ